MIQSRVYVPTPKSSQNQQLANFQPILLKYQTIAYRFQAASNEHTQICPNTETLATLHRIPCNWWCPNGPH